MQPVELSIRNNEKVVLVFPKYLLWNSCVFMGKQHVQGYSWAMNSFYFHCDVLMSEKIWILSDISSQICTICHLYSFQKVWMLTAPFKGKKKKNQGGKDCCNIRCYRAGRDCYEQFFAYWIKKKRKRCEKSVKLNRNVLSLKSFFEFHVCFWLLLRVKIFTRGDCFSIC